MMFHIHKWIYIEKEAIVEDKETGLAYYGYLFVCHKCGVTKVVDPLQYSYNPKELEKREKDAR